MSFLVIYAILLLYSRSHYRQQKHLGMQILAEISSIETEEIASICTSKLFQRVFLNFLPTAMLLVVPALEYAYLLRSQLIFPAFDFYSIIFAILGIFIHLSATKSAGRAVFELAKSFPGSLVTTGEYSKIRHPMSLSLILQGFAGGLMLNMSLGWILWAIASILMVFACYFEDRELSLRFDEYQCWSKKVGAFIRKR